ncbi:hypothetical protein PVK06_035279 [Gossypium arboreum]|uniref:Uncharacterized protein n=1 Tax=Gossypium arboreum TaxID=29729 RepID=A0ABR0NGE4_GOSAR|nr:hypothetical protein PVK06_035279 [Gossypium arboreum]
MPETLDRPAEFQTKSDGTRRGRGRTLLKDLYDLNPVECVKISRNSHGQPVASEARLLAGYLGIIPRNTNMLPINYESWHHMPDSNENQALDNIKEKLKEKKAEYETIASIDSSVNLENIDNKIITKVLGPKRYGRVRFQGSGVTPTQYFGFSSQQYMPSDSQAQAEI